MSLTKCKDCGKEVSTGANACPFCGKSMPKFSVFRARTYAYGAKGPIQNAEAVRQQLVRGVRYYNSRIEFLREYAVAQAEATRLPKAECEAARAAAHAKMLERERFERKHSGLYSGTYCCIEASTRQAAKMSVVVVAKREGRCARCKEPFAAGDLITIHAKEKLLLGCAKCSNGPRYRRTDDGAGLVAVQVQYGMTPAKLLSGESTVARLVGTGKRRELWLRVGSEKVGGKGHLQPVWAVFPVVYHRDIPAGARIKWVRLCTHRCGTHAKWSAQFVLEAPGETWSITSPTRGELAIDVGWRDYGPSDPERLRVATWVASDGTHGELRLPATMLARDTKVEDLRSIRDRNFSAARDALVAYLRATPAQRLGICDRDQTRSLHQWRSPARLAALVVRWRQRMQAQPENDPAMLQAFAAAEAWRKQDKHLLEWESHQREAIIRERREIYRIFARWVATHRKVTVEQLDLSDLARVAQDPDDRLTPNSRAHRFDAGLSYLIAACKDAVWRAGGEWVEADPAMTTQWCHEGDHEERFDAAPSVRHACSCGRSWDQDVNAALNLLSPPGGLMAWQAARAPRSPPKPAPRSRAKDPGPPGETGAERYRRISLERRRAKRSKNDAQRPDSTEV